MSSNLTALELLKLGDEGRIKPTLNRYWPQVVGITLGVGAAAFINYQTKRPPFSGIQKHAFGAISGSAILQFVQNKRDDYLAEKDAVLRHYIELHPEDFVEPERKKIGDILEPWIPIR